MSAKHDAVVAGHICLDIFPQFLVEGKPDLGQLFVPGRLINMGPTTFSGMVPAKNTFTSGRCNFSISRAEIIPSLS